MGYYVNTYDDLEEVLSKIDSSLQDVDRLFYDLPDCVRQELDLYQWSYGNYKDVKYDLYEQITAIRNDIVNIIEQYNGYIKELTYYKDGYFFNDEDYKKLKIEVKGEE